MKPLNLQIVSILDAGWLYSGYTTSFEQDMLRHLFLLLDWQVNIVGDLDEQVAENLFFKRRF